MGATMEMTSEEQLTASLARVEGRRQYMSLRNDKNPYPSGSFGAYCWMAGYNQDIRSMSELRKDWETPRRSG